jgi:hypothetical protein
MKDRRIVLDLETKKSFDDVGGRNNLEKLGISVVGIYDYSTDKYECYEEGDFGRLQNLLIDATLIIGFNHVQFDMPVLQPYLSVDVTKFPLFDIMQDLQKILGHRVGLDSIASATLGIGKTGSGLDAIKYYNEGRMEELKKYCLNDVKVTKEVFDYGLKNKSVSFTSKFGNSKKEVAVNWSAYSGKKAAQQVESKPVEQAQYKLF